MKWDEPLRNDVVEVRDTESSSNQYDIRFLITIRLLGIISMSICLHPIFSNMKIDMVGGKTLELAKALKISNSKEAKQRFIHEINKLLDSTY